MAAHGSRAHSLRIRMYALIALPLFALLGVGALALAGSERLNASVEHVTGSVLPDAVHTLTAEACFGNVVRHTRGVMLSSETADRTAMLDAAHSSLHTLKQSVRALGTGGRSAASASAKVHQELAQAVEQLEQTIQPVWLELTKNTMMGNEKAAELMDAGLPAVLRRTDAALHEASAQRDRQVAQARERAGAVATTVRTSLLVCIPVAVLLSAALGVWIGASVFGRIRVLAHCMDAIAQRRMSLDQRRIEIKDRSELGDVIASFNRFSTGVTELIGQAEAMTAQVHTVGHRIADDSERMAAQLNEQSEQTSQIAAAVRELAEASAYASESSTKAADSATQAGRIAREGDEVVNRTIAGMQAIREAVESGAQRVAALGARSEAIGQIIAVINDIADQTNLLALNAAIEAARAGEHGRGFAVVADEVRKLAERTTTATEEVAKSIREIQAQTQSAVAGMQDGKQRVESGMELAASARSNLGRIVQSVQSTGDMIRGIAAAIEQQHRSGEIIRDRVGGIEAMARQSAQAAQDTVTTSRQLTQQAEGLQQRLDAFTRAAQA